MLKGPRHKNVGFISFRLSGTDGVSLETSKWAEVFHKLGWQCYYLAGELDTPPEHSMCEPILQFTHPDIQEIYHVAFDGHGKRTDGFTERVHTLRKQIKDIIYSFVRKYDICLVVTQNALTIPLNLPFGMALTEYIAEDDIRCIAHHHDFFWERKRFLTNCVWDILRTSYPPHLENISHVVINSSARNQLALRTGIGATLIPNVMPFEKPAPGKDDYNRDIRAALGVKENEYLVLQPTRVVQRKGIELAIELVARMSARSKKEFVFVISHASGDEGFEYQQRLREYANLLNVKTTFESEKIQDNRGETNGKKYYSLNDLYPYADLVTYPSIFEGFGNAFLETLYFRKPIVVNNYSTYSYDIRPLGFDVVEFNNFISAKTVEETLALLSDPARIKKMVDTNYELGLRHFSYQVLEERLRHIVNELWSTVL